MGILSSKIHSDSDNATMYSTHSNFLSSLACSLFSIVRDQLFSWTSRATLLPRKQIKSVLSRSSCFWVTSNTELVSLERGLSQAGFLRSNRVGHVFRIRGDPHCTNIKQHLYFSGILNMLLQTLFIMFHYNSHFCKFLPSLNNGL